MGNLNQALKSTADMASQTSEVAAKRLLSEAGLQLAGADTKLQACEKLPLKPDLDGDSLVRKVMPSSAD